MKSRDILVMASLILKKFHLFFELNKSYPVIYSITTFKIQKIFL